MKRTSAELKCIARMDLQGHYGICIGTMVVAGLITSALLFPFTLTLDPYSSGFQMIFYYTVTFLIGMVTAILSSGVVRLQLKLSRKESPKFGDLFYAFTVRPDRFILSYLILGGAFILCTIPGVLLFTVCFYLDSIALGILGGVFTLGSFVVIVFLTLAFGLVYILLIDNPSMGVIAAFKESFRLTKGHKGRLFYIQLSFIGWIILGILSCYIGLLWIAPYQQQTVVAFYRELTGELDAPVPYSPSSDDSSTEQNTYM